MAYAPGLRPGRREDPISVLDFAPTVAYLLAVPLPDAEGTPLGELRERENLAETVGA